MLTVTLFTLLTRKRWKNPLSFRDENIRRAYIALCRIMEAITLFTIIMGVIAIFIGSALIWEKLCFNTQSKEYKEAKIAVAELYGYEPQQVKFYRECVITPDGDYTFVYKIVMKGLFKKEKTKVFYSAKSYVSSDGTSHSAKRLSASEEEKLGFSSEELAKRIDRKIIDTL